MYNTEIHIIANTSSGMLLAELIYIDEIPDVTTEGSFLFYFSFKYERQQYSCEIDDFVHITHLRKLCAIPRSRELWVVYVLMKDIVQRLPIVPASIYQGQQGDAKTFSL